MLKQNHDKSNVSQHLLTNEDLVKIFTKKFNQEWDDYTVAIPYSQALKMRGGVMNVLNMPKLPNNPDGDNLEAVYLALIQLEDALNDQVNIVNNNFITMLGTTSLNQNGLIHPQHIDILGKYKTSVEILAYIMKTTIDKVICLVSIATEGYKQDGGIKHDSIGSLVDANSGEDVVSNKIQSLAGGAFTEHYKFLYKLNNIHNAYKHTFSVTQLNIIDNITPTMTVVYKHRNTTNTQSKLEIMLCYKAMQEFEAVLKTMLTTLNKNML